MGAFGQLPYACGQFDQRNSTPGAHVSNSFDAAAGVPCSPPIKRSIADPCVACFCSGGSLTLRHSSPEVETTSHPQQLVMQPPSPSLNGHTKAPSHGVTLSPPSELVGNAWRATASALPYRQVAYGLWISQSYVQLRTMVAGMEVRGRQHRTCFTVDLAGLSTSSVAAASDQPSPSIPP